MKLVDLCAGIGGFSLGLSRAGFTPVAYSEIDPYACKVYERHFPGVPNIGDLRTLDPMTIPEADIWTAGFPCQPFSVAGKRKGANDERNLWPDIARLVRVARPRMLLLENVPAILGGYMLKVLGDLASLGYDAEWATIGADDVGAPHRRKRVWIWAELRGVVADADGGPELLGQDHDLQAGRDAAGGGDIGGRAGDGCFAWPHGWAIDPADVADADGMRELQSKRLEREIGGRAGDGCPACGADQGPTPPLLGRVASRIPNRVDRLRCLGNAVVPQVVEWIGRRILEVQP